MLQSGPVRGGPVIVQPLEISKDSAGCSSFFDVLDKGVLALLRPAIDWTSWVTAIREMLEPSIEQVIRCERRDCLIVCVEIGDRSLHVPSIPAAEPDDWQSGLCDKSGDCRIIKVCDNPITFPRAQVRQPLVFQGVLFDEDTVVMAFLKVRGNTSHHLKIIG